MNAQPLQELRATRALHALRAYDVLAYGIRNGRIPGNFYPDVIAELQSQGHIAPLEQHSRWGSTTPIFELTHAGRLEYKALCYARTPTKNNETQNNLD